MASRGGRLAERGGLVIVLVALISGVLGACSGEREGPRLSKEAARVLDGTRSVFEEGSRREPTWANRAQTAGLLKGLVEQKEVTFLVPSDAAVDDLLQARPELADSGLADVFLKMHVVKGAYGISDLRGLTRLESIAGLALAVTEDDEGVSIEGQRVTGEGSAANGAVIYLDGALEPPIGAGG